jgi:K+-transporting ATPase ATPase C chain
MLRRQLVPAIVSMVIFTVALGIVYPLVITGIGQVAFKDKADGSLVERNGTVIGSSALAQAFTEKDGTPIEKYFQERPSAASYDPSYSTGSNLGPTNPALIAECLKVTDDHGNETCDPNTTPRRAKAYRELNGLAGDVKIPVDAVTASGSGLDPDISIANARLQAARVAKARGLTTAQVDALIDEHTNDRALGIIGEKTVNVLGLNLALDQRSK